jgi:uncharacterized protein (TIGR04255 family)
MVRPRTVYPKAPITEALCDIRVAPRDDISFADIEAVAKALSATYPKIEDQYEVSTNLSLAPGGPESVVKQTVMGKRLETEDKKRIIQSQLTGQSVSRLQPYANWADLKAESERAWGIYRSLTKPKSAVRLALRYINRIDIPQNGPIQIEDYLRTYIEVSSEIKSPMNNFFAQIHIPLPSIEAMCIVNTAALPPATPEVFSILFDIDIFRVENIPQRDDDMWAVFNALRDAKNEIFEFSITDKTRELFK